MNQRALTRILRSILLPVGATLAAAAPVVVRAGGDAPSVLQTPPPIIVRVVARPLCRVLRENIAPAIGLILKNDQQVRKAPPLLVDYDRLLAQDKLTSGARGLALERMETIADTLADNIVSIRKLIDDPRIDGMGMSTQDAAMLKRIREQLQQIVAAQQLALNIVGGFAATQELHDLQHEGMGFVEQVGAPDVKNVPVNPTPNPALYDTKLQAGLSPDPYTIDPMMVPGLTVGYNPLKNLVAALHWSQEHASRKEGEAATTVMSAVRSCSAPPPTPKP